MDLLIATRSAGSAAGASGMKRDSTMPSQRQASCGRKPAKIRMK